MADANWYDPYLAPGIIVTIILFVSAGFIKYLEGKKSNIKEAEKLETERVDRAEEKKEKEEKTAKELVEATDIKARITLTHIQDWVVALFASHKQDRALHDQQVNSIIDAMKIEMKQIAKECGDFKRNDFTNFRRSVEESLKELKHSMELIQTMAWGPDAKSVPPYMEGKEQTQEHKDEADVGAFSGRGQGEESEVEPNQEEEKKEDQLSSDAIKED
jgi:hypothetical protein